ncbi:hypothetical protein A3715_03705 [Oleiphilus sp. HI0009]|nr:hypothetical protein A3715_03705 [Oleiphilus sp. HI0009]
MKKVSSKQTRYTNKLEGRSGTLWESRFKSSPIETDAYLLQCSRYVELNPVKAKMVSRPEEWPWSSYRAKSVVNVGTVANNWLDLDIMYLGLAANEQERKRRYSMFCQSAVPNHEQLQIAQALERSQLTGSGKFVDEMERRLG